MRKLFAALAAVAFFGVMARAEILGIKNIKTDGSFEVLGVQAKNQLDLSDPANDNQGNTLTRLRLGVSADITTGVKGRIEVVRNADSAGTPIQYGDPARPTSVGNFFDTLEFQNAYVDMVDFLYMDKVRLGRQYGGRKSDLLMYYGPINDDRMTVNSLDALSIWKTLGYFDFNFVTGKANEAGGLPGSGAAGTPGDINLNYLTVMSDRLFNLPKGKLILEGGIYQGANSGASPDTVDNNTLVIYDLRADWEIPVKKSDLITLGAQLALNDGQQNGAPDNMNYKGSAMVLKGLYKNNTRGFSLKAQYAWASGNDLSSTSNDDDAFHDFSTLGINTSDLRFGEILSNSNEFGFGGLGGSNFVGLDTGVGGPGVSVISLGGAYTFPFADEKFSGTADYYLVKLAEELAPGLSKSFADEIDLALTYTHNAKVSATGGYAIMNPKDSLTGGGAAADDKVEKLYAKLNVLFGGK